MSAHFAIGGALLLLLLAQRARAAVANSSSAGTRVLFRERASGVHPSLQWLLDEWERDGAHTVLIAGGTAGGIPYFGGLRTAAQQEQERQAGITGAADLSQTPHGRGAALDVWPLGFDASTAWGAQPQQLRDEFATFGAFAKARGFEWGGNWRTSALPNGDQPHVQIPNWQALPFPPPDYA